MWNVCVQAGNEQLWSTNSAWTRDQQSLHSEKEPIVLFSAHYCPHLSPRLSSESWWQDDIPTPSLTPEGDADNLTWWAFSPMPSLSSLWRAGCYLEEHPGLSPSPGTTIIYPMSTKAYRRGGGHKRKAAGGPASKVNTNTKTQNSVCKVHPSRKVSSSLQ